MPVLVRGPARAAQVAVGDGAPADGHAEWDYGPAADRAAPGQTVPDGGTLVVTWDGRTERYACARVPDGAGRQGRTVIWLGRDGLSWAVAEEEPFASAGDDAGAGDGVVRSPMPGTVRAVQAVVGEKVSAGQPLLIVEAMKMEHTLSAPCDGVVSELTVEPGQQVALDERLAVVSAGEIG